MSETSEPSPRAQAILRAIEIEAETRRQRSYGQPVPGAHAPAASSAPPAPPTAAQTTDAQPLSETANRLMRLVDHVVAQTEGVRARVKEVEQSLDLLSSKLAEPATLKPATVSAPDSPEDAEPTVPSPASPEPASPEPAVTTAAQSDGARLMAIEMAVSGCSRGEVGTRLTEDFGVADPALILDDVFGAGSPDSSRMPWAQ